MSTSEAGAFGESASNSDHTVTGTCQRGYKNVGTTEDGSIICEKCSINTCLQKCAQDGVNFRTCYGSCYNNICGYQ